MKIKTESQNKYKKRKVNGQKGRGKWKRLDEKLMPPKELHKLSLKELV